MLVRVLTINHEEVEIYVYGNIAYYESMFNHLYYNLFFEDSMIILQELLDLLSELTKGTRLEFVQCGGVSHETPSNVGGTVEIQDIGKGRLYLYNNIY